MKKLSVKFAFAIILAVLFIIGGGRANASEDGSSYLNLEVSKNQSGAYLLHINNVSKSNLKNIKGATTIPEKLKSEFGVSEVSWTLGELKSGESEVIPLNGKDKGKLPLLGSKQNFILTGLGLLFVLLFVAYLLNKKKFNMLLLLVLCLSGAVHAEKVFAQEKQAEVQIQTVFKAVDGNDYIFQSKVTFEVNDDGTEGAGEDKEIITVSGVAMDKDGAALKEKDLVIKSQNSSQTVTTDGEGNFFAQIEKGKDYQVVSDPVLQSVINVKSITDYQVDNKLGEVVLGKEFLVEGSDAYAKLNISTIYFEPSAEISHTETSLILSTVEKIQVGDIVVTGPRDDYDNGFSLKVDSIAIENGHTVLTGTTPQLLEVFQEIHIDNSSLDYQRAIVEVAEGVEYLEHKNSDSSKRFVNDNEFALSLDFNIEKLLKSMFPDSGLVKTMDEMKLSSTLSFNVNVDVSIFRPMTEQFMDISLKNEQKFKYKMTSEKLSTEQNRKILKEDFEVPLGSVYIPTGLPILGISGEVNAGAKMELTGKLNVSLEYSKIEKSGVLLKRGEITFPSEKDEPHFNAEGNIEGNFKMESGIYPAVNFSIFSCKMLTAKSKVAGEYNLAGTLGFSGSLKLSEKVNSEFDVKSSLSLIGEIKLFSPIIDNTFSSNGDNVLSATIQVKENIQKTKNLEFKDNEEIILKDNKLFVKPGQQIILTGVNSNGIPLSQESHLIGKPTLISIGIVDSIIKERKYNSDQIFLEINENAKLGSRAKLKVIYLSGGVIIYNTADLEIIVGEQSNEVTVSGAVKDSDTGSPISGAEIELFDVDDRLIEKTKTTKNGTYQIDMVPAVYNLAVKATGYEKNTMTITVSESNKKFDFNLEKEKDSSVSLWNQEKSKKLSDFMKKLGEDLNQEFQSYDPENNVIMYGTPLPESILKGKNKMVIGKEPVEVEWSETGVGKKEYQLVEVYSNADTQPWLEKEVFFFMFKENKPMVVVTTQSEWRPNDYMYFYETKNKELQEAFVKISRSGSVEDEGL